MFLKESYIIILLCLVKCEIVQCKGQTSKEIKPRKLEDKRYVYLKNSKLIWKNYKMSPRQNFNKEKEIKSDSTSKWPKLLRQGKLKKAQRFTKLDMLQDTEITTDPAESLEGDEPPSDYFSSYSIKQQLAQLKIPHANLTLEVIGRTLEYQDIVMLRISKLQDPTRYFRADDHKYAEEVPQKKIIFIVHGLSVMGINYMPCLVSIYYFKILLSYYTEHLDKFDIFLIPMANPDGFSYVKSHPRQYYKIWNKNVSPQSECPGVALDRNFEVSWSTNRSINSCSQDYPGPAPFSEPETRAIRDVFHKYGHKIIAYFNVHAVSYHSSVFRGDAVLHPKGYSDSSVDEDKYIDLKSEIDEAIRNASFQVFSVAVDTLYNWYGKISGTSVDYASTIYGIPFAMELVMQSYEEESDNQDESEEFYSNLALHQVWSRVIDVIFGYMWKSLHGNDVP